MYWNTSKHSIVSCVQIFVDGNAWRVMGRYAAEVTERADGLGAVDRPRRNAPFNVYVYLENNTL